MYNDEELETYDNWYAVLFKMLDINVFPTLIFYEKCNEKDLDSDK